MNAQTVNLDTNDQSPQIDMQVCPADTKVWIKVGELSAMPPVGTSREFYVAGKALCIANIDGEICATDNQCPHHGRPLAGGKIRGNYVVCPWHGWPCDAKTGETPMRRNARIATYKVSLEGEDVFVSLE